MNYTREELVQSDATMNQLRNAIYHLERFMKLNGITDIRERLRRMGKNIAHTYNKYWKPIDSVNLDNVKDVLATLYKNVLKGNKPPIKPCAPWLEAAPAGLLPIRAGIEEQKMDRCLLPPEKLPHFQTSQPAMDQMFDDSQPKNRHRMHLLRQLD